MFVITGRYNTFFVGYWCDTETGESFQVWDINKVMFFPSMEAATEQLSRLNDKADGPFRIKEMCFKQ